jgi:hypothetical protein
VRDPKDGSPLARPARLRLIGTAAVVAIAVFAPWAARNWLELGSPLPGQAVSNALFISGTDVFAWDDVPTLSRYLDQGLGAIIGARVVAIGHNLLNVLVYLGVPLSVIGLAALPWTGRGPALRPLLLFGLVTFLVTSLVFPVATTWGTFLHAAGAIHVLVVISALLALDGLIVRVGRWRGWTRPVAWLGPAFAVAGAALFSAVLLPSFGDASERVERRYAAIGPMLADADLALDPASPVITDFPIWLAETWRQPSLALPDEPPASVASLARAFPGTRTVLVFGGLGSDFVEGLAAGSPEAACFEEVALTVPTDPAAASAVEGVRAWRFVCP